MIVTSLIVGPLGVGPARVTVKPTPGQFLHHYRATGWSRYSPTSTVKMDRSAAALLRRRNFPFIGDFERECCTAARDGVRPNYRSRPYEFGGGIIFAFEHEGRIREAFVPPDLLSIAGQVPGVRAAVEYVERQPDRFIAAARTKAAGRKTAAMVMLDRLDR